MKTLQVTQLKPNPIGKDRSRTGASPAQLGGEWIDIKNGGRMTVDLTGVDIFHLAYGAGYTQGQWEKVVSLRGSLNPGWTLRVHAGHHRDLSVLHPEDRAGAELHAFTGANNYVWNNREVDTPTLWLPATSTVIDKTFYDPNPPEGAVLARSGNKLVSVAQRIGVRI